MPFCAKFLTNPDKLPLKYSDQLYVYAAVLDIATHVSHVILSKQPLQVSK